MKHLKRFLILALCLMCVFASSCSHDTPEPGNGGNKHETTGESRNTFSFDAKGIKTIASSKMTLNFGGSRSREITAEGVVPAQTLLVYSNDKDELAPLVFKDDANGQYIMFAVTESYPIDENTFAIEFSNIFSSTKPPKFLIEEKEVQAGKVEKTPIIEDFGALKNYHFNGQLIIDKVSSKASFLSHIDFGKFQGNNGELYYNGQTNNIRFNLKDAFVSGEYVYLTASDRGLWRVSLRSPKAAEPIVNSNQFSVDFILSANSKAILADGQSGYDIGRYLLNVNPNSGWPRAVDSKGIKIEGTSDKGYGYEINGVGNFNNEILIGDEWWNIKSSNKARWFYKLKTSGADFVHPLANGFKLGNDWIDKQYITSISDGIIEIAGYDPLKIMVDGTDETLYTEARENHLISVGGKYQKDYRRIMDEGFYVNDKGSLIKADKVDWNWYQVDGQRYNLGTDKTSGNVCQLNKKEFIRIGSEYVNDINRVQSEAFTIRGLGTFNPIAKDASSKARVELTPDKSFITINGITYPLYKDESYDYNNAWYVMIPNTDPEILYDKYHRPIHDDRLNLLNHEVKIEKSSPDDTDKLITVKSFIPDPMRIVSDEIVDEEAVTYYMVSDPKSKNLMVAYMVNTWFKDAEGNNINSIKGILDKEEGLTYYDDGNAETSENVPLSSYTNDNLEIYGKSYRIKYEEKTGKIYTEDTRSSIITATKVDILPNLEPKAGKTVSILLPDRTKSLGDYTLINVLKTETEGVYKLYFYTETKTAAGNKLLILTLDTINEALQDPVEIKLNAGEKLPKYEYSTKRKTSWDKEYESIVWANGGHLLCWLDKASNDLFTCQIDNGTIEKLHLPKPIANSHLGRLGDFLIVTLADNQTSTGTYRINSRYLDREMTLISTDNMSIIPLLELNALDF